MLFAFILYSIFSIPYSCIEQSEIHNIVFYFVPFYWESLIKLFLEFDPSSG